MKREELLKRIEEIYKKLENHSLESSEIDELVDLSNNLYERALVLRYKVAEQRIFGENKRQTINSIADSTDDLAEVNISESVISEAIDFNVFGSQEEKILEYETVEMEPKIQTTEMILDFSDSAEIEAEEVNREDIEPLEEKEVVPVQIHYEPKEWDSYFSKVLADYSTGIQKPLMSLAGSFGLNERILYINELFSGEAEKFSAAVLSIDKLEDWNSCKNALGTIANEQNWEKEIDTVGEFVLHVYRKYA
jgi:hypothetical protein